MKTEQCSTCAFRPGCETQGEPHNVLKAMICVLSGKAFFCHEQSDKYPEIEGATRDQLRSWGICHGWRWKIRKMAAAGWFRKNRLYRQAIGAIALDSLTIFTAADDDDPEKKRARVKLFDAIKILSKKDLTFRKKAKGAK